MIFSQLRTLQVLLIFCLISFNEALPDDKNAYGNCLSEIGSYHSIKDVFTLRNWEFPSLAKQSGSNSVCEYLLSNVNEDFQTGGILKYGETFKTICRPKCVHLFEHTEDFECGIRRGPPIYSMGKGQSSEKILKCNCSDLALPIDPVDKENEIIMKSTLFENKFTTGVPNGTWTYLRDFNIRGYTVNLKNGNDAILNGPLGSAVVNLKNLTKISVVNQVKKPVKAPLTLSSIEKMEKLEELSLRGVNIQSWAQPNKDLSSLRSVNLHDVDMTIIPEWLTQATNLNILRISDAVTDKTDLSVLNNLPTLEHFLLERSTLTALKKPFLEKSINLISLTIQCTHIKTIEEGLLDHLPELRFLAFRRNLLTSLPSSLFAPLKNLLSLEISGQGPMSTLLNTNFFQCPLTKWDQDQFYSAKPICIETLPTLVNPEKIKTLTISQCPLAIPQLKEGYLKQYSNIERLRISEMNLTSLGDLHLQTLCKLSVLHIGNNIFSEKDWFSDDFYINNSLESLIPDFTGIGPFFQEIPLALLALAKTKTTIGSKLTTMMGMKFSYSTQLSDQDIVCEIEIFQNAAKINKTYTTPTCAEKAEARYKAVMELEKRRLMENACDS